MIGGVTRQAGLPSLLGRVTLSAGVAFCHVNDSRWGNPPSRGQVHVTFAATFSNITPGPGVVTLHVNADHFPTTARWVTSPTWGPQPPCKQALSLVEPNYTPGWREALCLPKNTTQCPQPGLKPRLLDLDRSRAQ